MTGHPDDLDDLDDLVVVPALAGHEVEVDPLDALHLIDWSTFWDQEPEQEWIAEPLIPKGRSVALVAPGKAGKSLLLLDVAAAVATGRPILGRPNSNGPRSVLYLDYEMVRDDVAQRLADLGYGPDDNLANLHYALLPSIDPLDVAAGGRYVLDAALRVAAELAVIDTLARAVSGDENSADTYRAFYLHTGLMLKQAGVTCVRADHSGHQEKGRARGSSAKADDVDVVWTLSVTENGCELKRTHSRVPWVPERVVLRRLDEPLRHELVAYADWPAGTKAAADRLDQLGAALTISRRDATQLLRDAGPGVRSEVLGAALRYRRNEAERAVFLDSTGAGTGGKWFPNLGNHPEIDCREPPREPPSDDRGNVGRDQHKHDREPLREPPGTTVRPEREPRWFPVREPPCSTGVPGPVDNCRKCSREQPLVDGLCPACTSGESEQLSSDRKAGHGDWLPLLLNAGFRSEDDSGSGCRAGTPLAAHNT